MNAERTSPTSKQPVGLVIKVRFFLERRVVMKPPLQTGCYKQPGRAVKRPVISAKGSAPSAFQQFA
jgi:hypothetical protein